MGKEMIYLVDNDMAFTRPKDALLYARETRKPFDFRVDEQRITILFRAKEDEYTSKLVD